MAPIDPTTVIYEIPDSMLAECHVERGAITSAVYHFDEPDIVLIPLRELRVPAGRALDPARLRRILEAIAAREPLPAVPVFREPNQAVVLDGMHRFAVATALGFASLPCIELTLEDARDFYRYPEGQR
jgi:ParB-like chromosome segregation protein Spo0J